MTIYDFDQILDRRKSDSLKWRYYEDDVIPMWVADMDFVSPEPVLQALHERVDNGVFGYPVGLTHLQEKVSGLQKFTAGPGLNSRGRYGLSHCLPHLGSSRKWCAGANPCLLSNIKCS
jgi:hypothetical protein